jgi:uncharacterized protein
VCLQIAWGLRLDGSFAHDKIVPMIHAEQIASQLNAKPSQVMAVISLLDEDNTVPFIARYRKEMTGSLDDEQIRIIADELVRLRALDERRITILASIEEQVKLTHELRDAITAAVTMLHSKTYTRRTKRNAASEIESKRLNPFEIEIIL